MNKLFNSSGLVSRMSSRNYQMPLEAYNSEYISSNQCVIISATYLILHLTNRAAHCRISKENFSKMDRYHGASLSFTSFSFSLPYWRSFVGQICNSAFSLLSSTAADGEHTLEWKQPDYMARATSKRSKLGATLRRWRWWKGFDSTTIRLLLKTLSGWKRRAMESIVLTKIKQSADDET